MTNTTTCMNSIDCNINRNQNGQKLSSWVKNIILKLKQFYAVHRQRKIDRDAFLNLLSLDEAILKDIGVSRDDITWASKLAMHKSASKELEKVRANNIATAGFNISKKALRLKLKYLDTSFQAARYDEKRILLKKCRLLSP